MIRGSTTEFNFEQGLLVVTDSLTVHVSHMH